MTDGATTDVLVVDFDDAVRTSTAAILRSEGLTVAEADDGDIAFDLLGQRHFGVVLLELDLPKRSGIELLDALDDPPPVVIVSAYEIEPDDCERIRHKVVGYFRKPVAPRVLIDTVAALLR
jgi:DNA-binding response OmpR family regulator